MKIFIRNFAGVYFFQTEAETNRGKPEGDERMAAVSARKGAEWRKLFNQFSELQGELKKLYEGTPDKS